MYLYLKSRNSLLSAIPNDPSEFLTINSVSNLIPLNNLSNPTSGLNHSIAEIITHMMAWRQFVIEKLNGNAEYEVWETDLDWVKISSLDNAGWENILTQLADNQTILIETINKKAEELLDVKVDSRQYNFRLILAGIIQHDIYHIGQISIIRKLIN